MVSIVTYNTKININIITKNLITSDIRRVNIITMQQPQTIYQSELISIR